MSDSLYDLTEEQTLSLPIDRLAIFVLKHLKKSEEWSGHNFINSGKNAGKRMRVLRCWSEGLNWLISNNLVARDEPSTSSNDSIFITRLGCKVINEGGEIIFSNLILSACLHSKLRKVQSQFLIGEYELAAFAAMREVEITVRSITNASSSDIGVRLMRNAFGDNGSLTDGSLDGGEKSGIRELFSGAIATFKNPSSHRQVDYTNPMKSMEVILFANLLMSIIEDHASKMKKG